MTPEQIAEKYVHGKHENITDADEKREMAADIQAYAEAYMKDKVFHCYDFQNFIGRWLYKCFGKEVAENVPERCHRFLEEALELVQSLGTTAEEAKLLVDYTFGRPKGETPQEIGGVMVTLAALCEATHNDMLNEAFHERDRIIQPEIMEKIRLKQAGKPKHSPLPQ